MLAQRRKTRQIRIGDLTIGGDAPIRIQSMTTTKTSDVNATLQQIASLVAAGVDTVTLVADERRVYGPMSLHPVSP